jgi:hypothetical protein
MSSPRSEPTFAGSSKPSRPVYAKKVRSARRSAQRRATSVLGFSRMQDSRVSHSSRRVIFALNGNREREPNGLGLLERLDVILRSNGERGEHNESGDQCVHGVPSSARGAPCAPTDTGKHRAQHWRIGCVEQASSATFAQVIQAADDGFVQQAAHRSCWQWLGQGADVLLARGPTRLG